MSRENTYVMYLIEKDIQLSDGKGRAQCAHASHKIAEDYYEGKEKLNTKGFPPKEFQAYRQWTEEAYTKIVLSCPVEKWESLKNLPLKKVIIRDAGYTEVEPGTETVIGFWPIMKKDAPKEIKELKLK